VAGNDDDPTAIRERILSQNALQGALAALRLYYGNYGWGRTQEARSQARTLSVEGTAV
jgi:hypothetical protein